MSPSRIRERIRAAYKEETRDILTVGQLIDYMMTRQVAQVSRAFLEPIGQMMRPVREGRNWINRDELRLRYKHHPSRIRSLTREEILSEVAMPIRIRVEEYAKEHHSPPDVLELLSILSEHERERRLQK